MTHAHAPHERDTERRPQGHPVHVHTEQEGCPSDVFPVPVPGRALPAPGGMVIRRQKADAETYAQKNKIKIEVSRKTVEEYVNDTDNDDDLRRGLLDAWNLDNARWAIDTPADLDKPSNPFHFSVFDAYKDFNKQSQGVSVDAFGGSVSAAYKRGAPKLGSNAKNWGKTTLGDSYVEYIRGLRSGGLSDVDIADGLLTLDESAFASDLERRAAAMMTVTVYLGEEWRKQGAAKIYRANLRLIAAGTRTFDDFLTSFKFIESADKGRRQVGEFYDVHNGDAEMSDMDSEDQAIYSVMSPARDEDFSSEDEMRDDNVKNLAKKRLYAQKHDQ